MILHHLVFWLVSGSALPIIMLLSFVEGQTVVLYSKLEVELGKRGLERLVVACYLLCYWHFERQLKRGN